MRTLIFGGTFDPVHKGHVEIAESIRADFDEVIILPAADPPHKEGASAAASDRINMCSIAFPNFEVNTYEIDAGGVNYTANTLEAFTKPGRELYFLLGADSLIDLPKWYRPDLIAKYAVIVAVGRPGYHETTAAAREFEKKYSGRVIFADCTGPDISSSEIRILRAFGDISALVPAGVARYIEDEGLYREFCAITARFPDYGLDDTRIEHIKNTALTALKLAKIYGADTVKTVTAALLHDIAKNCRNLAAEYYLRLPPDCPPKVVHSYLGARIAERDFGIKDKDILNAVRYHTAGRSAMSLLEKIIYAADYIEPARTFSNIDEIRRIVYTDLDEGVLAVINNTVDYHRAKGRELFRMTLDAQRYYTLLKEKKVGRKRG